MPYPTPDKDTKRTKMKKISNQPVSETPSPSTSKEPNKSLSARVQTISTNNLSHHIPLPKDSIVKFIQVSPLKSVPKQNIPKLMKLTASPLPGLNVVNFPRFQMPNSLQTSKIQILKPVKTISGPRIVRPLLEIAPKPPQSNVFITIASTLPISNITTSIPSNTASKNVQAKMRNIPSILQKQAQLNASKNASGINEQIKNTIQSISNREKVISTINVITTPTIQEPIEKKPTKKQYEASSIAKRKAKEKQMIASPRRKEKSSKKKEERENKDKDTKGFILNEESAYVADGFREDVERLVEKCLQVYKLNFEKFSDIWKEMNFPCIFHGRQSSAELAELSEEVIHIAKAYMLAKNVCFEENVAGLFLVYALLNHQPFSGFASLRLTPDDVPYVLSLEVEARRQKRHDVLYVLGSVLIKGPCQFHVLAREVSLEAPLRKYHDGTVQVSKPMDSVFTRNAECVPHFKELISLEQRYQAMRQKLNERQTGRGKVSELCKRPAARLYELYRAHIPSARLSNNNPEQLINDILCTSKPEEDRSDLLKSIKERAMTNTVDPMRHLTGLEDRQDSTSSSSEESEMEGKRSDRKRKVRGKGRASAKTLQELFGFGESTEKQVLESEHSTIEMPTLDLTDDLTTDLVPSTQNKKRKEEKTPSKKARKKVDKDDSKNNNNSDKPSKRKRKNNMDGPTAKRKTPAGKDNDMIPDLSDPNLDVMQIEHLLPAEDRIEPNLDVTNDDKVNKKNGRSKITENISNNIHESLDQENTDIPSIIIEFERDQDIEMELPDDCQETKFISPKKEKGKKVAKRKTASNDVSNNNTVPTKDIDKNKSPKKAPKVIKENLKNDDKDKNKNIAPKKSKPKKNPPPNPILDPNKSEENQISQNTKSTLKRKTKSETNANKSPKTRSSNEQFRSPLAPRTRKRTNDQTKSPRSGERKSSPRKTKNTVCKEER